MVGTNMVEELDCGSFFDHIDDLLEFPNNDIENAFVENDGGSVSCQDFATLWPDTSLDSELPGSKSVFSSANGHTVSDLSAELSVPYEDIVQLEWLSTFVEDSFSSGRLTLEKSQSSSFTRDSSPNQFQTSSPVSVFESSSACSNGRSIPISHEKRARSKRLRPATFTPRVAIQLIPPTSSITDTPEHLNISYESKSFTEARPLQVPAVPQKKKKIKILPPSNQNQNQNENPNANPQLQAVRKCMHCEITKTPQWRAGPMGPKSLCNACGVRYKSGRLFPEYRPAASPTFVPSIHSNSHKKVLEMRTRNNGDKSRFVASGTTTSTA